MNPELNVWLCRNFDREKTESDEFGRTIKVPKKGYVTFWDIIEVVIIEPLFTLLVIIIIVALILVLAIAIPGSFMISQLNLLELSSSEFLNATIYGLLGWVIVGLFLVIIYGIYTLMQYKVAVCPLSEKKKDEFGAPQDDDSRLRPDLKEVEEKMFKDIIGDGDY